MESPDVAGVAILLSTYNGSRYLSEQLHSLRSQTYQDWSLWVRDDGSTDDTLSILDRYARMDNRIHVLASDDRHLGSCQSFGRLLEQVSADYLLFCDQDDIWLTDKVARLVGEAKALEQRLGIEHPILIHSDLRLMGARGEPWKGTLMRAQKLHPLGEEPLKTLLVQNVVTGCASLINRALQRLVVPFPREAVMHDWWVALVAASAGTIHFFDVPTVLYRQHEDNEIGLRRPFSLKSLRLLTRWTEQRRRLDRALEQGVALRRHLDEVADAQGLELDGMRTLRSGGIKSLISLARQGIRKQGIYRNTLLYLVALKSPARRT